MKYLHGDWDRAGGRATPARRRAGGFDLIVGSDLLYERDATGRWRASSVVMRSLVRGVDRRSRP
jgi:hypothetical protein